MTQSDIGIIEKSAIRLARDAVRRDPIFKTADDNHGRAVASAIYRMANSEIARCYLRLVASSDPIITEMVEALEALAEAARSSCDARQFQGLTEALADADALLAKVSGK